MENKYEKEFTIKMIFTAIKRHFRTLIYFLICFTAIGYTYGYMLTKVNYKSTGSISTTYSLTVSQYGSIVDTTKYQVPALVETDLAEQGIKHADGTAITLAEINNGLGIPEVPNTIKTLTISFSYTNSDKSVVKPVLNSILQQSVKYNNEHNVVQSNNPLAVVIVATEPTTSSNPMTKLLLFLGAGLVIGALIIIVKEWNHYAIDTPSDIVDLEKGAVTIEYRGGNKNAK